MNVNVKFSEMPRLATYDTPRTTAIECGTRADKETSADRSTYAESRQLFDDHTDAQNPSVGWIYQ